MDRARWWPPFVDLAAVVWIGLFAADLAIEYDYIHAAPTTRSIIEVTLIGLLFVFLADILLGYHWSDQDPIPFVRSNWLWILTVVPWFRPLRVLRIARGIKALRILAGSRRLSSFLRKARRLGTRIWERLRG